MADKWYDLGRLRHLGGEDAIQAVGREIAHMGACAHPHIQRLAEVIDDPQSRSVHLLQPLAPLGSLESQAGALSQGEIAACFAQIASALAFLHSRGIAHRDVKPSNILCFARDRFALSDFSSASALPPDGLLPDTQGTPAFLSPEEARGGAFDGRAADVWAFGVAVFSAVFRRFPFDIRARSEAAFVQTLLAVGRCLAQNALAIPAGTDERLADLLRACLEKEAALRPSAAALLRFPWLAPAAA
jgi:serine/threonine protein kinase